MSKIQWNNQVIFILTRLGGPGWGGAHKVAVILANFLADKGYLVSIVSREKTSIDYHISEKINVKFLGISDKSWKDKLNCIYRYREELKSNKGATVIAFTSLTTMYVYLASFFLPIRIIAAERTDPKSEPKKAVIRAARNLIFTRVYRAVFQTPDALNYFPGRTRRVGKVIPNPIASNIPPRYTGQRKKEIVNFCRLDKQKNLSLLVDAFLIVHEKHTDYILRIYGTGLMEEEIKRYIIEKKAENFIFIEPFEKNIHEKVRDCSAYVSSSDYEGLSNSMLEALAIGLPCICTDCPIGGARMVIRSYDNGILVPTNNKIALADAILEVIENPELSEKLSINAEKIREQFTTQNICNSWEALLTS